MTKSVEEILSSRESEQEKPIETPPEPIAEVAPPPEPRPDRERDEKGRFAAKKEAAEPDPIQPKPTEPAPQQKQDTQPDPTGWQYAAYKDKSEQAKHWRGRAENAERELAAMRQQIEQQTRQVQAPDMFADPQGYHAYWEEQRQRDAQQRAQERREMEANFSLRLAHREHKQEFVEAYNELIQRAENGDRAGVNLVLQSGDPGEALMSWWKREKVAREIGDDPNAYREKLKAELMAELQQQPPARAPMPAQMPSNLAAGRSVGSRTGPEWTGPTPLADALAKRR